MSYISDALRKARKVKGKDQEQIKKTIWKSLWSPAFAEGKKNDTWQKRHSVLGLSITLLYAVGIISVMYWPDIKTKLLPVDVPRGPVQVTVAPIPVTKDQKPPQLPEVSVPQAAVLQGKPASAAGGVDAPKTPVLIAPAGGKLDKKNEAAVDAEPEPPVKEVSADPKKLYAKALKKQQEGNLEDARELYRQVIELQPANAKALNNLGVIYMKMKRYRWAIVRLNEAVRIRPRYADAQYNLACLYAQLNNTQKSLFYLKNAVKLNPEAKTWAAQDGDFKGLANIAEYKTIIQTQDN